MAFETDIASARLHSPKLSPELSPKLSIERVSVTFSGQGVATQALAPVDLSLTAGRFVTLIGPSGCGKSTLFNVIAGLTPPTTGIVRVDGEDVTGFIGQVGYMLQKDLLLPWRTVLDNVALGMELRGMPMRQARKTALPYLQRYGLGGFEDKLPRTLSGGMRQRAALLRTLLADTDIILLDEPFGALDAQTKHHMQEWLLQIWADFDKTVVFITHDVEEAIYLSDEICVMTPRPGRIVERFAVELDRPRPRDVVTSGAFVQLKQRCLGLLSEPASEIDEAA